MATSAKKMAKKISKMIASENPNYDYIRDLFRYVRQELDIPVTTNPKRLPYVPTEGEIKKFYRTVWEAKNTKHLLMIKTLLYTGIRVSELINIKLHSVDLDSCQICITQGKGKKDRIVPFPNQFKETLVIYYNAQRNENRKYLFESGFRRGYTDRGVRKILAKYTKLAGIERSISPHKLRHFLFTWLKKQNIDDALIQPYSGHEKRESLEIYSKLSITEAQNKYDDVIKNFPV
ncbi:tyrosine-type recombinase/integrase [Thiotrichales bacterium 19S11-10]|nr:tyrosine-type recombinase/integrase [Thiotrichales bacterium 19S11-10]